jgi:hypothetical protein
MGEAGGAHVAGGTADAEGTTVTRGGSMRRCAWHVEVMLVALIPHGSWYIPLVDALSRWAGPARRSLGAFTCAFVPQCGVRGRQHLLPASHRLFACSAASGDFGRMLQQGGARMEQQRVLNFDWHRQPAG